MRSKEEMLEEFKKQKEGTKTNNFTAFLYAIGSNAGIINNRECRFEIKSFLEEAFDMDFENEKPLSDEEIKKIIKNIISLFNIDLDGNLHSLQFGQKNTISGGTLISEKIKQIKIEEKRNLDLSGPERVISQQILKMKFDREDKYAETGKMYLEKEKIIYSPDQTAILFEKKNTTIDKEDSTMDFFAIQGILEQVKNANSITIEMKNIPETGQDRITATRKRRRQSI